MRLLLTTHVFFPHYSAGTEVLTLHTAQELRKLGHEVEICTGHPVTEALDDDERFDSYDYMGIRVRRFFRTPIPSSDQENVVEAEYNNHLFARWFRDYVHVYKPDIVHFFHLGLLSASAIDICRELAIPMVMTPTDFWLVCPNNQLRLTDNSTCAGPDKTGVNCLKHAVSNSGLPLSGMFQRLPEKAVSTLIEASSSKALSFTKYFPMISALAKRAGYLRERMNRLDIMLVPTRMMERVLVNNGLDQRKVVFCPYGIQYPKEHYKITSEVLRIGFIGGLSEHKGAHVLIAAAQQLPRKSNFELRIYGDQQAYPQYFRKLLEQADKNPRIHFMGTFPNEMIGKIFSEIDVLVVPSLWHENTPLVVYSSQAASCPVVASDVEGISEIIRHEVNGLLFEKGDIAALAAALERLINDKSLQQVLINNCIKPKSIQEYAVDIQAVYNGILEEKQTT